jgi:predicted aspartyl protease
MKVPAGKKEDAVGRITIDVKLANRLDVEKCNEGSLAPADVRRAIIPGTVENGASYLILPARVAKKLGVPKAGKTKVKYADRRVASREMVDLVEVELVGRKGTFRAVLEPNRTTALIGAMVLEDLDILVDSRRERIYPRDPECFTAEAE